MKPVDEALLERDPVARFEWVAAFIGFDAADQAALLATAPLIAPRVPQRVVLPRPSSVARCPLAPAESHRLVACQEESETSTDISSHFPRRDRAR